MTIETGTPNEKPEAQKPETKPKKAVKPRKTCGYVALLGESNVGKSTLLNRLVKQKLAIVSSKLHSTRRKLLGIVLHENAQIIFIDTPGLVEPNSKLQKSMLHAAYDAGNEADVIALMVDATKPHRAVKAIDKLLSNLQNKRKNKILIINKIDLVPKEILLDMAANLNAEHEFSATLMISATKDSGLKTLLNTLAKALPFSAWHYPEDHVTDTPMKVLASEITREKLYTFLNQELPYACTVHTESFDDTNPKKWLIEQVITVEKTSQRAIILGHQGQSIKKIGQTARITMGKVFETTVDLRLFVKVDPKWQDNAELH